MNADNQPWFVRAALGAVAWVGGLSLMTFLGLILDDISPIPIGVAMLVAAVTLRRLEIGVLGDFWSQLALLFVVTGRLALGAGLYDTLSNETAALAQIPIELALFFAYPGTAPRIVALVVAATSVVMAAGADVWVGDVLGLAMLAFAAVVSENEERFGPFAKPLMLGCVLWPVATIGGVSVADGYPWALSLGVAVVGAALAARWLNDARAEPFTWVAAGASAAALFAIGGPVPGTLAGLLSAGMAFRRQDRLWLGASLAALVAHGVNLYWQMHVPFLQKGGAMIGLGAVLLVIATLAAPRRSVT